MSMDELLARLEEAIEPSRISGEGSVLVVEPGSGIEMARLLAVLASHGLEPALPWEDGPVRISPRRMNSVLHLDRQNLTVRVQTGIRWEDLEHILREEGLTLGVVPPARLTVMESLMRGLEPPGVPFVGSGRGLVSSKWALEGALTTMRAVKGRSVGPRWDWALVGRTGLFVPVEAILTLLPLDGVEVRRMWVEHGDIQPLLLEQRLPCRNVMVRHDGGAAIFFLGRRNTMVTGERLEGLGPWDEGGYVLEGGRRQSHPLRGDVAWNCDFRGAFVPQDGGMILERLRIR